MVSQFENERSGSCMSAYAELCNVYELQYKLIPQAYSTFSATPRFRTPIPTHPHTHTHMHMFIQ
jgi:hypothetical protein